MSIDFESIQNLIDAEDYDSAIANLESLQENQSSSMEIYWYLGLAYLLQGNAEIAQQVWLSVFLELSEERSENLAYELLTFLETQVRQYINQQRLDHAKIVYDTIFDIEPDYINLEISTLLVNELNTLGTYLRAKQDYQTAIEIYQEALTISESDEILWRGLANSYYHLKEYADAEEAIKKAINLNAYSDTNYQLLGMILGEIHQYQLAIKAFQKVIEINPKLNEAYAYQGDCYIKQGKPEDAINIYMSWIDVSSSAIIPSIYEKLAEAYHALENTAQEHRYFGLSAYYSEQFRVAVLKFNEYLKINPRDLIIIIKLCFSHINLNQIKEAATIIEDSEKDFPGNLALNIVNQSLMPMIYKDENELLMYRQRYENLLDDLIVKLQTASSGQIYEAYNIALPICTTFFLGYQGKRDLIVAQKYHRFIYQFTSHIFPWSLSSRYFDLSKQHKKVRIGYISLHYHSLGPLYLNWIKYRNIDKFEAYVYDISGNTEIIKHGKYKFRENFIEHSDVIRFTYGKRSKVEDIAQTIIDDKVDILLFLDIGLSQKTNFLSSMRLAPIQCAVWGNPMTTGSPNIDYFLSSELMEPQNATQHYSEKLTKLPNLGLSLSEITIPDLTKTRQDLGIFDNKIIYLCCQNTLKYLPQFDYLFPAIALENELVQFVFVDTHKGRGTIEYFKERLEREFIQKSLIFQEYCLFLDPLPFHDYLMLHQLSDIFLDTFAWSGGVTTRDAIACGLPIVTCPGEMMRSRQSYGMLNMIGVTETIAENEQDYIDIAIRLGQDHQWRQSVRDKMQANKHKLFNDKSCIVALEQFFEDAIAKKLEEDAQQQNSEL